MQMGCKFFRTDEAVLTSDWATNMALIAAFDMRQGQFIWFNKAYEANRRAYQKMLKANEGTKETLRTSRLMTIEKAAQVRFSTPGINIESGKIMELNQAKTLEVEDSLATKEGVTVKGYSVMFVMTPSTAAKCENRRRGLWSKGKGKSKGKQSFDFEDMIYTELVQIPDIRCPNQHCKMIDGYLQCPRCYQEIGANTDARIATEVARREAMARVRGVPFSMEAVEFHVTRRSKQSGRATSAGVQRSRSAYGALRDLAKNYRRQVVKKGYKDVVDRLERDCFFHFNCASQNLTPDALVFLTRVAGCISPQLERTKDQVHGEALMAGTKLVFIPEVGRDPTAPLSLQKETFIVHRGVFLTPGQFAVLVVKFIKARGDPLPVITGWGGSEFLPEEEMEGQLAREIVTFAKAQWLNYASKKFDETGVIGECEMPDLPRTSGGAPTPGLNAAIHEQFDPNQPSSSRDAPYSQSGKGKGKGKGQGKGKGKHQGSQYGKSSHSGGSAYGKQGGKQEPDYRGSTEWHGRYSFTWFWNSQRGWYWKWD